MGVLHSVLLLNASCVEWLDGEGVPHPDPAQDSRFPTPREITAVLRQFGSYSLDLGADLASGEWSATVVEQNSSRGMWASLRITDYSSDDEPHEFYFPKGWPEVILTIVERLTHGCGPLVVVDDSAVRPIVVCPNDSIQELLRKYEAE